MSAHSFVRAGSQVPASGASVAWASGREDLTAQVMPEICTGRVLTVRGATGLAVWHKTPPGFSRLSEAI